MNRGEYQGDPRYRKVLEQMDLLGIMDVSTTRQSKNGTIVWKLPIKNQWRNGKLIEVGSFKSGMVRNQNSAYSNYQLNKCKPYTEYFKHYEWNKECTEQTFNGKYRKYTGKQRILIPIEIDRLEYLISYCLKNYYIKHANFVANGDYVPKWQFENAQNGMVPKWKYDEAMNLGKANDCGHYERINDLEEKIHQAHNKHNKAYNDGYAAAEVDYKGMIDNLSVTVNGQKYKVI